MHVQIWSDFTCPFCMLGKKNFKDALVELHLQNKVEILERSFELNPEAKSGTGENLYQVLAKKFGKSEEAVKKLTENIQKMGKEAGLEFNFDIAIPANTFQAHRLMHYAREKGRAELLEDRLFHAYLMQGLDIGNQDTLLQLAEDVGLNGQDVYEFFSSEEYGLAVRADEQEAQRLGIQGVPFFVFNNQYALSGAQPVTSFIGVMTKILENEPPKPQEEEGKSCCSDGNCQ